MVQKTGCFGSATKNHGKNALQCTIMKKAMHPQFIFLGVYVGYINMHYWPKWSYSLAHLLIISYSEPVQVQSSYRRGAQVPRYVINCFGQSHFHHQHVISKLRTAPVSYQQAVPSWWPVFCILYLAHTHKDKPWCGWCSNSFHLW